MIQNFVSKLSPKEKKIFYVTAIFVLAAFLDRLFLGPAMSKLKSLEEEIEQQENVIRSDLRFLAFKDRILKENKTLTPFYTAKLQTPEEVIAAFLKKIEILASESKVNLIKVTPAESKQRKGYMEYYANLECDGHLEDITKFIYSIDTSNELLKIIKLSISPKKGGSEDINAAMTVVKVIIDDSAIKEAEKISKKTDNVLTAELDGNQMGTIGRNREGVTVTQKIEAATNRTTDAAEEEIPPSVWGKFMEKKEKTEK